LKCAGLSTSWITTGAVTAPPACMRWAPNLLVIGEVTLSNQSSTVLTFSPPVPPPR
jgi:hypothetical protein